MPDRRTLLVPGLASSLAAVAAAGIVVAAGPGQASTGTSGYPADKMTVSGSTTQEDGPGQTKPVLTATMRTSAPEDLVLQLTSECDILTSLTNTGSDTEGAFGQVRMFVTIDNPSATTPDDNYVVPVADTDTASGDRGRVVFCNRAHTATSNFAGQQSYSTTFDTMTSNAFNWVALNVGSGVHTIVVWAEFTATQAGTASQSSAYIAKRTLVVDPTKAAHDETLSSN